MDEVRKSFERDLSTLRKDMFNRHNKSTTKLSAPHRSIDIIASNGCVEWLCNDSFYAAVVATDDVVVDGGGELSGIQCTDEDISTSSSSPSSPRLLLLMNHRNEFVTPTLTFPPHTRSCLTSVLSFPTLLC